MVLMRELAVPEAPADAPDDSPATALMRLADEMRARSRDAQSRREWTEASAFRHRAEAYAHAAAIVAHFPR